MENTRKLVINFILKNEKILCDMTKDNILHVLNKKFNKGKDEKISKEIINIYTEWKELYIKSLTKKPRTQTMSFRVTKEEKLEISMLLQGRNIRDILLEVLRNEKVQ